MLRMSNGLADPGSAGFFTLPAMVESRTALERTSVDLLSSLFPFPKASA